MSKPGTIDISTLQRQPAPRTAGRPRASAPAGRDHDRAMLIRLSSDLFWRAKEAASRDRVGSFNALVRLALEQYLERQVTK